MALCILVAFEAFQDIEAICITVFGREPGGMARANARAAEKEQHIVLLCHLRQLLNEIRVRRASRIQAPLDGEMSILGKGDTSYPVAFGIRPYIDQFYTGRVLRQGIGFRWRNRACIRQLSFLPALAGS